LFTVKSSGCFFSSQKSWIIGTSLLGNLVYFSYKEAADTIMAHEGVWEKAQPSFISKHNHLPVCPCQLA
jgi:hypothetical protein